MILTKEQEMIREMAREFSQRVLAPNAAEWDRQGEPPIDVLRQMGDLGLMGMCIPQEWGGAGLDFTSYLLAIEEVSAGCGGIATAMSVNNSPVGAALHSYGTNEQKERFLRPLAQGKVDSCFCLTEPQAGSDASSLLTLAKQAGDGYVLNGTKQFVTSGSIAKMALVFAVTDPDAGKKGISAFIIPTDLKGYHVANVEKKLGQKVSDTCQIVFEDMEVSSDMLLGKDGQGYKIALANLELGRVGIAAQAIGMAQAAFEAASQYSKERETFGTAIINHQAIAFRLADMATQIEAARQLTFHTAQMKDNGLPCLTEASMAKLFASEMAEKVCSDAIQIHGGNGYLADFPVERIYRDVRVCQIYEGTSDIQRIVISRSFT